MVGCATGAGREKRNVMVVDPSVPDALLQTWNARCPVHYFETRSQEGVKLSTTTRLFSTDDISDIDRITMP